MFPYDQHLFSNAYIIDVTKLVNKENVVVGSTVDLLDLESNKTARTELKNISRKASSLIFHNIISAITWKKVFFHDTAGGVFTSGPDALRKNAGNANAKLFSVLNDLETLRLKDGTFHLKLCYPELSDYDNPCNEWTQTSNPATNTTIGNFRSVYLAFPMNSYGNDFGGLGVSPASSSDTLIACTPYRDNWYFAVGALRYWGGVDTIPGPFDIPVKKVELYAEKSGKFSK